jgi:hypothetical protein
MKTRASGIYDPVQNWCWVADVHRIGPISTHDRVVGMANVVSIKPRLWGFGSKMMGSLR